MSGLSLLVRSVADEGPVRTLTLVAADDAPLPAYVPGSHLVLDCGGQANAYSLLDDGAEPAAYRVSVLHLPAGRGGSRWVHEVLRAGELLRSTGPRSAFPPVAGARHQLLVAAGIGVTPLLSHARAARRWGRPLTFLYRGTAHLGELRAVCGGDLEEPASRPAFHDRLSRTLVTQPLGTHLYVCGPPSFLTGVLEAAAGAGWPAERVHAERFTADALDPGRPFVVRVGTAAHRVPAGVSALEVLEAQGFAVPSRCRQGVCGECRTGVLAGRPEHRDLFLTDAERAADDCVLPCVSRALDDELELAL